MITVRGDRGPVDGTNDIALDRRPSKRLGACPPSFGNDAAIVFRTIAVSINTVYVMNIETGNHDVVRGTEIVEKDMDTATNCRLCSMVCDLQVANLDILDVVETNNVLDPPWPSIFGFGPLPYRSMTMGDRSYPMPSGQLSFPGLARFEQNAVPGPKGGVASPSRESSMASEAKFPARYRHLCWRPRNR